MTRPIRMLSALCAAALIFVSCNEEYYSTEPDLKATKMEAVGTALENMARQPDMIGELSSLLEQTVLKSYEELLPLTGTAEKERGAARGTAIGQLFLAVARQPEAADRLDAVAAQFLGPYDRNYISKKLNEFAVAKATPSLLEAVARTPETAEVLYGLALKYLNVELKTAN